jgi:hypothetical protein
MQLRHTACLQGPAGQKLIRLSTVVQETVLDSWVHFQGWLMLLHGSELLNQLKRL